MKTFLKKNKDDFLEEFTYGFLNKKTWEHFLMNLLKNQSCRSFIINFDGNFIENFEACLTELSEEVQEKN